MSIPVIFDDPHVFFEEATKQNYTDAHDLFYRSMVEYLLDESIQYICTFIYNDYDKYLFRATIRGGRDRYSPEMRCYTLNISRSTKLVQLIFDLLHSED